jgi:transcriptional regulator GlxA family with amidase domain
MAQTPAHFVESLRLEKARLLLVEHVALKHIALATGYTSTGPLSKAFERRMGMPPSLFRELHGTGRSQIPEGG